MKKFIKVIFGIFLVIILGIVLVLGYFGFVPGVSNLLGSNKPRDLEVRTTAAEYDSYIKKAGTEMQYVLESPVVGKSIVASGKKRHNGYTLSRGNYR